MAFDREIKSIGDIPGSVRAQVDKWAQRKSLLEAIVQYFEDNKSDLPSIITSGAMPLFLLDVGSGASSGKALVNPYIAFKGSNSSKFSGLNTREVKDWREGIQQLLKDDKKWNNSWRSGRGQGFLTMFSDIAFGQSGVSYSSAAQTAITESMQAVACAARQGLNQNLTSFDLTEVLLQDSGSPHQSRFNSIYQHVFIRPQQQNEFNNFINRTDAGIDWVASCAWIANTLKTKYLRGGTYNFYRQDLYPTFKNNYTILKDQIKSNNAVPSVTKKIFAEAGMAADKWNPADIIAVKTSFESSKDLNLNSTTKFRTDRSSIALRNSLRRIGNDPKIRNKIKAVDQIDKIYEYNKWVDEQFAKRNVVPISLKKATSSNVKTQIVRNKDTKVLDHYTKMEVDITSVDYLPENQKCLINFTIGGVSGYILDARGFEKTANISNIQIQLMKTGSSAAHGKVTLPVTQFIAKLSGGRSLFPRLQSMRSRAQLPRANNGFMDFNIIRRDTATPALFAQNWSKYADYISSLAGSSNHSTASTSRELDDLQNRGPSARAFGRGNTMFLSKWIKNKVQSYEVGFMLEYGKGSLSDMIKDNITKSMFLYAGSKGFMVFGDQKSKTYLQSSTYVKAGG